MKGALYVSDSGNTKIMGSNKVDATYASIAASCPTDCPFMGEGCYAQLSYVGMTTKRLNKQARKLTALQVARMEARAINEAYKGGSVPANRDLRLHVAGDSRTVKGTRLLAKAVARWKARGGKDVWSYTHAWGRVPRKEWGTVSVLASVSSVQEADRAREQGYAPAIVVDSHASPKAFLLPGSSTRWIPCPSQTKEVGCSDCRLCFNANRLFESNMGIAFAAHGPAKNSIKRHLKIIQEG